MEFTKMERWMNNNPDYLGQAFVGFTENGTYLTFDIRRGGGKTVPIFSPICEVGVRVRQDCYENYRKLFTQLDGYCIEEIEECEYRILTSEKTLKFKGDGKQKV